MVSSQLHYTKVNRFMPFLLVEILNFQGSTHRIGVGSFSKRYKKPISKELAKLLQSSIEYTQEKFGDTEYIFVNEKEPDRPMQYMAIKTKVMSMIQEKQLKDRKSVV